MIVCNHLVWSKEVRYCKFIEYNITTECLSCNYMTKTEVVYDEGEISKRTIKRVFDVWGQFYSLESTVNANKFLLCLFENYKDLKVTKIEDGSYSTDSKTFTLWFVMDYKKKIGLTLQTNGTLHIFGDDGIVFYKDKIKMNFSPTKSKK